MIPCQHPGCPELLHRPGLCVKHKREEWKAQDTWRGSASQRGYDSKGWNRVRTKALMRDGFKCQACGWEPPPVKLAREHGISIPPGKVLQYLRAAKKNGGRHFHVDHIQTIRDRPDLRLEMSNLQTLCDVCHNRKTRHDANVAHE